MLSADAVTKRFAGIRALDGASIEVGEHEIVGLLGPNGSGKSTLLAVISGFLRADAGTVRFQGRRIDQAKPWDIAGLGLRRTFQLPRLPRGMTVLEVMLSGAVLSRGRRASAALFRPRAVAVEQRSAVSQARALLDELTLIRLEHHAAGTLSGGQQKLLSLGAALMTEPRILLLDEPTAGVHPNLRNTLVERLRSVRSNGTSLVIVEHDMAFVQQLCERAYVLDKGQVIAECAPADLVKDPKVVEAYLGSGRGSPSVQRAGFAPQGEAMR